MIYLVSNNQQLFSEGINYIPLQEAIDIINKWDKIQIDSETDGRLV